MATDPIDEAVAALAAHQCAAFARRQAYELGVDRSRLTRRVAAGRWLDLGHGVLGFPGQAATWHRRLWIAHLQAGPASVVSHESAAALHGMTGVAAERVVLTVPHPFHRRLDGAVVHQISDLLEHTPDQVTSAVVPGLPVTTPARTVVDLAASMRRPRLKAVVEHAADRRITTDVAIGACLTAVSRRGKPGARLLAGILDERAGGGIPPASELERVLHRVVGPPHFPPLRRQLPLPGRGIEGFVDGGWHDVQLIVEADGRTWHRRIADMRRDRERDAQAARAGWQTLRFMWEHLVHDPDGCRRVVADVRAVRAAQLGRPVPPAA